MPDLVSNSNAGIKSATARTELLRAAWPLLLSRITCKSDRRAGNDPSRESGRALEPARNPPGAHDHWCRRRPEKRPATASVPTRMRLKLIRYLFTRNLRRRRFCNSITSARTVNVSSMAARSGYPESARLARSRQQRADFHVAAGTAGAQKETGEDFDDQHARSSFDGSWMTSGLAARTVRLANRRSPRGRSRGRAGQRRGRRRLDNRRSAD